MNLWTSPSGAIVEYAVCMLAIRWGGGAALGKTHVVVSAPALWQLLGTSSWQCVTDDFGNLVAVS